MRSPTRLTTVLVAILLTLGLVGAGTAAAAPPDVGTASTDLLGAEIEITGVDDSSTLAGLLDSLEVPEVLRVLNVETYASNDTDADRNQVGNGSPFAVASIVPLQSGDQRLGESRASSDGDGSQQAPQSDVGSLNDLGSLLGARVAPVTLEAQAAAEEAFATIDAAVAQVDALANQLGIDLDVTTLRSDVDQDRARGIQAMRIAGFGLDLGDLVPQSILGQLPVPVLLDLLDQLPIGLSGDLDQAIADVTSSIDGLSTLSDDLTAVESATDALTGSTALSELTGALGVFDDVQVLQDAYDLLTDGDATNDPLLTDLIAALDSTVLDSCDLLVDTLLDCVTAGLQTLVGPYVDTFVAATALTDLADAIQADATTLEGLAGDLDAAVQTVTDQIDALLADLQVLDDLLGELEGLLPEIASQGLVDVGALDVGARAIAADTVEDSSAEFLCNAVDVTVVTQRFTTPDCSEGVDQLDPVTGSIADAVTGADGLVGSVLGALPLGNAVALGDLRLDLFPQIVEEVARDGNYVTATARGVLLELQIPSLTIDPTAVTGGLPDLTLPGILDTVQTTLETELNEALTALNGVDLGPLSDYDGLDATLLDGAIDPLQSTLDGLDVDAVLTTIDGLIADITGLSFGDLVEPVTTPGLRVSLDPGSEAEYLAAAAGGTTTDETDDEDRLPRTGGGAALAVLGLLGIGGGVLLRRRH